MPSGTFAYGYDANGNMQSDNSKTLNVTYNLLNLPQVNTITGGTITYTYDAEGKKLRKVSTLGTGTTTDYIDGIQYNSAGTGALSMSFIQTEEGQVLTYGGTLNYEYNLTDHLGNTRLTFDTHQAGTASTVQQDDYMPFGMDISAGPVSGTKNYYLYNKKELQPELTLYDYGARFYDPVTGRFTSIDPSARSYVSLSPYNYVNDNPIGSIDPDGRDLIVLNATSHVLYQGHAAVLIGNPQKGYNYYSKNGTHDHMRAYGKSNDNPVKGKHFDSIKDFEDSKENKRDGPYDRTYELKANETTDKQMEEAALKAVESDYYVLDQSCVDVASDALTAGKFNPGIDNRRAGFLNWYWGPELNPIPNRRFREIVIDNPGGHLTYWPAPKKEKKATVIIGPLSNGTIIPNY